MPRPTPRDADLIGLGVGLKQASAFFKGSARNTDVQSGARAITWTGNKHLSS